MATWFKFYGPEYLSDPKLLGMDGHCRSCWLTLLCYASEHEGVVKYLTEEQLMVLAGVPMGGKEWQRTEGILQKFVEKGMISMENGQISIQNWGKRQSLSPYDRVKRYRERQNDNGDDNAMITADKTREEEKREDKNILFDRVWSAYPKKQGKKPAQIAFERLKPTEELTARIVSAIALAKTTSQWKDNEGRYVPHCATYLNQCRFEDELPAPEPRVVGYERTERGMRPVLDPEVQRIAESMRFKESNN